MVIFLFTFLLIIFITEDAFIAMIISVFILFVSSVFTNEEPYSEIITKKEIYSIGDNYSNVNGHFTLGSGYINSQPQYSYFVKLSNNAKIKEHINSNDTQIFEGNYKPTLVTNECIDGIKFSWFTGLPNADLSCRNYKKARYELYLPSHSVIESFNIK